MLEVTNLLKAQPVRQPTADPLQAVRIVVWNMDDDVFDDTRSANTDALQLFALYAIAAALDVVRVKKSRELVEETLSDAFHVVVFVDEDFHLCCETIHSAHVVVVISCGEANDFVWQDYVFFVLPASTFELAATLTCDQKWQLVSKDVIISQLDIGDRASLSLWRARRVVDVVIVDLSNARDICWFRGADVETNTWLDDLRQR